MGAVAKAVYFAHLLYPYPLVLLGFFWRRKKWYIDPLVPRLLKSLTFRFQFSLKAYLIYKLVWTKPMADKRGNSTRQVVFMLWQLMIWILCSNFILFFLLTDAGTGYCEIHWRRASDGLAATIPAAMAHVLFLHRSDYFHYPGGT